MQRERLTVVIDGLDLLWALRSHITVPLDHVDGARVDPHLRSEGPWLGAGHTRALLGYAVAAGPMLLHGRHEFWDVHDPERAVVIDLHDEPYSRLVIEVKDPAKTIAAVNEGVRRARLMERAA